MKKFYILLFSILFTPLLLAQNKGINITGFISTTNFEDTSWFSNTNTLAVNIDAVNDDVALRMQLAEPNDTLIRRLTVEKSFSLKEGTESIIQIGRFPRLDSFYNVVTDAPSSSGLAMLPMGEYNRRLVLNRTFNTLDGIRLIHMPNIENGILKLYADYGSSPLENQCSVQMEATKKTCRDGYEFQGNKDNYDLGFSYELDNWNFFTSMSSIKLKTNLLNPSDRTSVAITTIANKISFDLIKVGLKYSESKWWVQSELLLTDYKLAKSNTNYESIQTSENIYVLGGIRWLDHLSSYLEYSYGTSNNGSLAIDRAIGTTYINNNTTVSLEYHRGSSYAWKNYLATDPNWNSWVLSVTQRF